MKAKKSVVLLITAGALCVVLALGFALFNIWDEQRATEVADEGVAVLRETIIERPPEQQQIIPEPQAMMTEVVVEDQTYVGILEIPGLSLSLPIQSTWSEALLRDSPCLYEGDLYEGMIIAGHNYRSHFASLTSLTTGDEVRFTDADGNVWRYTVSTTEVIDGSDIETMVSGDWDLTLFTCTYSGAERFTVRCTLSIGV